MKNHHWWLVYTAAFGGLAGYWSATDMHSLLVCVPALLAGACIAFGALSKSGIYVTTRGVYVDNNLIEGARSDTPRGKDA